MQAVEVGRTKIGDREFIFVVRGTLFETELDGQPLSSESWEGLVTKVAKAVRKSSVKISIPFSKLEEAAAGCGARVRNGLVTGIHGANGNLLVKWDDGKSEQARSFGSVSYVRRLSAAEARELVSAANAAFLAQRAVWDALSGFRIDLQREAARAVREAQDGSEA
jgi:hypothetical protein